VGALVDLPNLISEDEAAATLKMSVCTLRRKRRNGEIAYVARGRGAEYLPEHLIGYIKSRVRPARGSTCAGAQIIRDKSEISGSPSDRAPIAGIAPGMTPELVKLAEQVLIDRALTPVTSDKPRSS